MKEEIWSNYSDLTRPHPKWWFSKGIPLTSGKSRLVKYYNLARRDEVEQNTKPCQVADPKVRFFCGRTCALCCGVLQVKCCEGMDK